MFVSINPVYFTASLFFIAGMLYIYLMVATHLHFTKSKPQRVYTWSAGCLALYAIFYGLMILSGYDGAFMTFWALGFLFGYMFFPVWLIFLSSMVKIENKYAKQAIKILPLVCSNIIAGLFILFGDTERIFTVFGSGFNYSGNIFSLIMFIYASLLIVIIFALHIKWWRESELKRYRTHAGRIFFIIALITPVAFSADYIIPVFTNNAVIPLGSIMILIPSLAIFVSVRVNQTFSITVPNVSGYIFRDSIIPTLVLDHKNNVGLANKAFNEFYEGNVIGENIAKIVSKDEKTPEQEFFARSKTNELVTVETKSGIRTCEMMLSVESDKHDDPLCKVVLLEDVTESEYNDKLLDVVHQVSSILLEPQANFSDFETDLNKAMGMIARAVKVDRMYIWKNYLVEERLFTTQIYEWSEHVPPQQGNEYTVNIPYDESCPSWQELLPRGKCVNGLVKEMDEMEQAALSPQGIISLLVVPVFLHDEFWGLIGFDDCVNERIFTENEEIILRSVSKMLANALIRNKMTNNLKETSEQLETALDQAYAASRAKSEFLSSMSHEMRTPLNAIFGMTTLGKKAKNLEEKNFALGKIEAASSHLLGVISDVLDMAKIEANKLELYPVEYNFEKMLEKVISIVNFRIEEKNQIFTFNLDNNLPRFVIGDDQRLAQVLTNLLSNAVKFTPEGGNIHLDTALLSEEGDICKIRVEVSDSGIGISNEQIKKLFSAFGQASSGTNREFGGTGLGLVISKSIVSMMDGQISIESEEGIGTKVIFTANVKRSYKNMRSMLDPQVNWSNVKVLVVDDSEETRKKFIDIFAEINQPCDVAADGREALDLVREKGGYDIYFVDWKMPNMDGLEFTKQIKSTKAKNNPVVIMVTSADWSDVREEAAKSGVDMHMLKPIFSSYIIDCMNVILCSPEDVDTSGVVENEFAGKSLLLAEDVEINREIFIALLEGSGIGIDCARNGYEAIDMVSNNPGKYDIVLMDIQMPQMDGLKATEHIRSMNTPEVATLPIIAMTANVFREDIEACEKAGMNAHIGKPLDIEKVLEVLRKYLFR
ncbi:MAG: response regulator [Oscillospiraceae bacterium]|nr:response regulator [Oscillospiraceae bacterium]MCL2280102.1 response regulator [Oscillospiraceae bacterium]